MDIERQNFMKECEIEVKQSLEKKLLSLPLSLEIHLKELKQEISENSGIPQNRIDEEKKRGLI